MAAVMGIDVGTGGLRALVIDAQSGALLGAATAEYPLSTPHPQWAEQDPQDWWRAAQAAIPEALRRAGGRAGEVLGLGLTGQMHGLVLLDEQDAPIRPAMLWCDQRTEAQCEEIHRVVGRERLLAIARNPALTGFTAPKVLWVREHEPEAYRRVRRALLPKDYLRLRLSGEYATDVADASGTLLLDVGRRAWSEDLLAALEIPREWLPAVYEGPEVVGRVSAEGARATGLAEGLPIVAGGGDQAAGGVGNGVVREGVVSCTIGTSGVVFAAMGGAGSAGGVGGGAVPEALQLFCHSVPGMWHVMGVTQGAGLSLRWLRDEVADAERGVAARVGGEAYELLTQEAARAPAGCEGLLFLPYLMGERAPHLDPDARGGWIGLTARHTRADLVRSVMEGVTYSLRDCMGLLEEAGVGPTEVRASGGGARSALWRQMQADVFGLPVVLLDNAEGPAFGAALLAGTGVGLYPDVATACAQTLREAGRVQPDEGRRAVYAGYYEAYRRLYPALKETFGELAALARGGEGER
ncbi:MAG TPA: xylulokinase [Chloroflexota bacterium]|nr:xylulokinase [Chloroflexota bacterium]